MFVFSGTFEEDNRALLIDNERRTKMLEFLKDYKPSKVTDGYQVIKGMGNCNFNHCRIEVYDGDNAELQGHEFIRYELQICDGEENQGRRFWKSIDISDEDKVKKFADVLWTVTGLEFKDKETLQSALDNLAERTVSVRYWGFVSEKEKVQALAEGREPEKIQTHIIKGLAKDKGTTKKSDIPF
jgi:hypothetical protein